jgi:hypothetical protein
MSAAEVVTRWRSVVGWPAGWLLLERAAFVALARAEAGPSLLPVHAVAALLDCHPERLRSLVRRGVVRGFAFPAGHNWLSVTDARALLSEREP